MLVLHGLVTDHELVHDFARVRELEGHRLADGHVDGVRFVCEVVEHVDVDRAVGVGGIVSTNVRTTLALGQARGVILLAGARRELAVHEYSPAEVKSAIVGSGRATKEQVQFMVQRAFRLRTPPQPADAADGVAVALCHCTVGVTAARIAAVLP